LINKEGHASTLTELGSVLELLQILTRKTNQLSTSPLTLSETCRFVFSFFTDNKKLILNSVQY